MQFNLKEKEKKNPPPTTSSRSHMCFFSPSSLAETSNPDIDTWCRKQTLKDARHSSAIIMGF
jgi:hypothetical protein